MPDSVKRFLNVEEKSAAGTFEVPMVEYGFGQPQGVLFKRVLSPEGELKIGNKVVFMVHPTDPI